MTHEFDYDHSRASLGGEVRSSFLRIKLLISTLLHRVIAELEKDGVAEDSARWL